MVDTQRAGARVEHEDSVAFVTPRVPVTVNEHGGRWSAEAPGVPGCAGGGDTREQALRELEAALSTYFAHQYERAVLHELVEWQNAED